MIRPSMVACSFRTNGASTAAGQKLHNAPQTLVLSQKLPITSLFGHKNIDFSRSGVFEMTLLPQALRGSLVRACRLHSFIAGLLAPSGADAQNRPRSRRARHRPPRAMHGKSPSARRPLGAQSGGERQGRLPDRRCHERAGARVRPARRTAPSGVAHQADDALPHLLGPRFRPAVARRRAAGVDQRAERAADQDGHAAQRHGDRARRGDGPGDALGQRRRRRARRGAGRRRGELRPADDRRRRASSA